MVSQGHRDVIKINMSWGNQGRIQDLKLGVAQMDGKIWKPGGYYYHHIYIYYTG